MKQLQDQYVLIKCKQINLRPDSNGQLKLHHFIARTHMMYACAHCANTFALVGKKIQIVVMQFLDYVTVRSYTRVLLVMHRCSTQTISYLPCSDIMSMLMLTGSPPHQPCMKYAHI